MTIKALSPLPDIVDPVLIAGQSGAGAVVPIAIDGSLAGAGTDGLRILVGPTSVSAIAIHGFAGNAITINGSGNNIIVECYLGVDNTGAVRGNGGAGVLISSSSNNWIGYPEHFRSVMSGNQDGIRIAGPGSDGNIVLFNEAAGNLSDGIAVLAGTGNIVVSNGMTSNQRNGLTVGPGASQTLIQGNVIGEFFTGNVKDGILIDGSANNQIGGTDGSLEWNFLLKNGGFGISLVNGASGNVFQGNRIGAEAYLAPEGNVAGGINISDSSNNIIGGTMPGASNLIQSNQGPAVRVTGASTGNTISGNTISRNGFGIDLGGDGVTPNDDCDTDAGPNGLQNFPVLSEAVSAPGNVTISGTLNSAPNTTYTLEFFSNPECASNSQGLSFLGSTSVTTDASCSTAFIANVPVTTSGVEWISATATDTTGSTSEFSTCVPVAMNYYSITPCRVADTRTQDSYNRQPIPGGGARIFQVSGLCGIPLNAQAISFNLTVTQPTAAGDIRIVPDLYDLLPIVTLVYSAMQSRAISSIRTLGVPGDLTVYVDMPLNSSTHVIIDVNGYFQ